MSNLGTKTSIRILQIILGALVLGEILFMVYTFSFGKVDATINPTKDKSDIAVLVNPFDIEQMRLKKRDELKSLQNLYHQKIVTFKVELDRVNEQNIPELEKVDKINRLKDYYSKEEFAVLEGKMESLETEIRGFDRKACYIQCG